MKRNHGHDYMFYRYHLNLHFFLSLVHSIFFYCGKMSDFVKKQPQAHPIFVQKTETIQVRYEDEEEKEPVDEEDKDNEFDISEEEDADAAE